MTQSTSALAESWLAAISRASVFAERARQGHEEHAEPKDGIKKPGLFSGWSERKNKNLIHNRIKQEID